VGAKRSYIAEFLIGAKLLSSFKGAMAQAQARLKTVEKNAAAAGKSILKFGAMFSTVFAGLAAFGVGAIFKKYSKAQTKQPKTLIRALAH
jgi:hypothetical protein